MTRAPYARYKPSGVEWLGDVPEHWEVKRLKTSATYWVSNVDKVPSDDEEPVRLCNYTDVYYHDHIRPDMGLMETTATSEEIRRFGLRVDDVVITKDSEEWSDIAVPALVVETAPDLVCGYHLATIRPAPEKLLGSFLLRTFQACAVNQQFQVAATGVTRYGLPKSAIGEAWLPIPKPDEQRAIADFLDRETSRLDQLIAKKRELIERLKEKRTALISRTVTRGLPADAAANAGLPVNPPLPAPSPGRFFVYAIECSDGSHYIGQTQDLRKRWKEHVEGRAAEWTAAHPAVRLAHYEEFESREAAVQREKYLRTGFGRKWLKDTIASGRARQAGLKPSALDWLGDIPKHWEIVPLGYLVRFSGGATPDKSNSAYWDGSIPWVSPKDMKVARISDAEDHVSPEALANSALRLMPVDSVLIVVRGMILAHSFPVALTTAPVTINQDMKAVACGKRVTPHFLSWSFTGFAKTFVSFADESAHGTRKLETGTLTRFPFLLPPLPEQAAIAAYLDEETAKLDALVGKVEEAVERLQEYRTALITAAVTGKIDVRRAVANGIATQVASETA